MLLLLLLLLLHVATVVVAVGECFGGPVGQGATANGVHREAGIHMEIGVNGKGSKTGNR